MHIIADSNSHVKHQKEMPLLLAIFVRLINLLFPGWQLAASPKPRAARRRQYSPRTMEAALSLSLRFGYNAIAWEAVNG